MNNKNDGMEKSRSGRPIAARDNENARRKAAIDPAKDAERDSAKFLEAFREGLKKLPSGGH
jgi:hypothetical protein